MLPDGFSSDFSGWARDYIIPSFHALYARDQSVS